MASARTLGQLPALYGASAGKSSPGPLRRSRLLPRGRRLLCRSNCPPREPRTQAQMATGCPMTPRPVVTRRRGGGGRGRRSRRPPREDPITHSTGGRDDGRKGFRLRAAVLRLLVSGRERYEARVLLTMSLTVRLGTSRASVEGRNGAPERATIPASCSRREMALSEQPWLRSVAIRPRMDCS